MANEQSELNDQSDQSELKEINERDQQINPVNDPNDPAPNDPAPVKKVKKEYIPRRGCAYDPALHLPLIKTMASKGFTLGDISKAFGIVSRTLDYWLVKHIELRTAWQEGKNEFVLPLENSMRSMALDPKDSHYEKYRFQSTVILLQAHKPSLYIHKQSIDANVNQPFVVTIAKEDQDL